MDPTHLWLFAVLVFGIVALPGMDMALVLASSLADVPSRPLARTFGRAVTTCLLNPKAYVFMIAVFPQFIVPRAGALAPQALVLGAIIAATQLVVYGLVAQTAARLRDWLRTSTAAQARFGRTVGVLLLAAAALTLHSGLRSIAGTAIPS